VSGDTATEQHAVIFIKMERKPSLTSFRLTIKGVKKMASDYKDKLV